MKKVPYLLIMAMALILSVSCDKDEENFTTINPFSPLIGTWEDSIGEDISSSYTFNEDSTGLYIQYTGYKVNDEFEWSTNGNILTYIIDLSGSINTSDYTYSVSGDTLTLAEISFPEMKYTYIKK